MNDYVIIRLQKIAICFFLLTLVTGCTKVSTESVCNQNVLPDVLYKVNSDQFQRYQPATCDYKALFVNGINLGVGTPGKFAGDLETGATYQDYMRWFTLMTDAGFSQLRIYTIHMSFFYDAFYDFNSNRLAEGKEPLLLFHGIWLDEFSPPVDLVSKTEGFYQNIVEVIDAVHGNTILDYKDRPGKGYGVYLSDISPWVIGWILAREIHPDEVVLTNTANSAMTQYNGVAFGVSDVSPTEVWLTKAMDEAIRHERTEYEMERPVSFTSWPTLDPLTHVTENLPQNSNYEDSVSIDLANIDVSKAPAGTFFSFHAYPYYPDFISEDPAYRNYQDSIGPDSYLGYLAALKSRYRDFPVLIAEYGTPSSWGNVHSAHNGIHHGGHSEVSQGKHALRMLDNMESANTAGGLLFAWLDEWWKPTWLTNEFDFPHARRAFWHNVMAPEQNYGLLAFDAVTSAYQTLKQRDTSVWTGTSVTAVEASADVAYFYLQLSLANVVSSSDDILIALDTYDDIAGEVDLSDISASFQKIGPTVQASEFVLHLYQEDSHWLAQLYVTEAYSLYGLRAGSLTVNDPVQKLQSISSNGAGWKKILWITNYNDYSTEVSSFYGQQSNYEYRAGALDVNAEGDVRSSKDAITISEKVIEIRLPWSLLQFVDPSQHQVFHDDKVSTPLTWNDSVGSDGIAAAIVFNGNIEGETERYLWQKWKTDSVSDPMPDHKERIKDSYKVIKDKFLTNSTL